MNFQNLWLYISLKTSRINIICLHMSGRFNVQHRLQLHIPVILCSNLSSVQLQVKWTVTPDGLDHFIVASFVVDIYYHKRIWHRLCSILVNCVLCSYGSRWCASNCYPQIQYEQCSAAIILDGLLLLRYEEHISEVHCLWADQIYPWVGTTIDGGLKKIIMARINLPDHGVMNRT